MSETAQTQGERAAEWWCQLRKKDRGGAARLRRCATVTEAMQEPAALRLFRLTGGQHAGQLPGVAMAASVLAHVRKDISAERPGLTTARLIGPESLDKPPETALVKPIRFRRLMEAEDEDERLTAFRRLVAITRGELPVVDLASALLNWTDARRRFWVLQYWNAVAPSPTTTPAPEDAAR